MVETPARVVKPKANAATVPAAVKPTKPAGRPTAVKMPKQTVTTSIPAASVLCASPEAESDSDSSSCNEQPQQKRKPARGKEDRRAASRMNLKPFVNRFDKVELELSMVTATLEPLAAIINSQEPLHHIQQDREF